MTTPAIRDSRLSGEDERRVLRRDPHPQLFRPLRIRSVELPNRIALSPMCQYSADNGVPNAWHFVHLGARAAGGTGLVFTEAVHSAPRGRITRHCLGLWNEEQAIKFAEIAQFIAECNAVPGIQVGHAGRKASVGRPWEGTTPIGPDAGGWEVIGPSPLPYAAGWPTPAAMSAAIIDEFINETVRTVRLARDAGFQVLEIHGGHGYLLHQFYSPLSNQRTDRYGGSFTNRIRLLIQTLQAVRAQWPNDKPLFLRLSCTDWVDGGWSLEDTVNLARILKREELVDLVDCTSGGNDPRQQIPIAPGYQIGLARRVKAETGVLTGAVGLINAPDLAEATIAGGDADIVLLGRALLADPTWALRAAATLKYAGMKWPIQYERSNIY